MRIASIPRHGGEAQGMLVIDPANDAIAERTIGDLPEMLAAGDVVVVNDAATMPASLAVRHGAATFELRLAGPPDGELWPAVLFGAGDWRTDTDLRPAPPALAPGAILALEDGTALEITAVSELSPRHVTLRFATDLADAWATVLRVGRPIQYAYMQREVSRDEVQTRYAGRPWSVEMPSAGRPLGVRTIVALRERGIEVVALTHAAGLSATGDARIDILLPLPERYDIPASTCLAIAGAKARGGRVIAVGTSVVRALEGSAAQNGGQCRPGTGITSLVLGPASRRVVVDAVLSGVHEPGTSHHALLGAFAGADLLMRAHRAAVAADMSIHEFGDSSLVLPGLGGGRAPGCVTPLARRAEASFRQKPQQRGEARRQADPPDRRCVGLVARFVAVAARGCYPSRHRMQQYSFRRRASVAVPLVLVALAVGCGRGRVIKSALPDEEPPRRAAESFVHCVEAGTSDCVAPGADHAGWDALHLLLWLASGSPVGILEVMPTQLTAHGDPLRVQGAFVDEVQRYATALRGAECESTTSQPAGPLIDKAASSANARLERLGMSRTGLARVIDELRVEAHSHLDGGHLVRLDCRYDPYRVYVATSDKGGHLTVVGMTTLLAPEFGGDSPSRRDVDARLGSAPLGLNQASLPLVEGAVSEWLPFAVEEL